MDWRGIGTYILSGLVLWGVQQAGAIRKENHLWRVKVDARLSSIEQKLGIGRR